MATGGGFSRGVSVVEDCQMTKWLQDVKDAEVMILYSSEDFYQVSKIVLEHFKKRGVRYIHPEEHFMPGELTLQMLSEGIDKCKKLLLIVSNFKNSHFSLEILLALEKCQRTNCLNLIVLVLDDFDKSDIPKVPMIQNAAIVRMNYNVADFYLDEIIRNLRDHRELSTVLPAGNFSTGLAWSHFFGFLEIILPELRNLIRDSDWYRNNIGQFPERFFILLPTTARAPSLPQADENIKTVGQLPAIKRTIAGAKREYRVNVYKLTAPDNRDFFFCGEIPSAFGAISKVYEEMLCKISAKQRDLEVQRFSYVLQEIINHRLNESCNNTAKIIVYNDDGKGEDALPSYQILKVLRESKDGQMTRHDATLEDTCVYENDVCLIHSEHDDGFANHVRHILEEDDKGKKLRVSVAKLPGEAAFAVEDRIREARWVILFVSKFAMRDANYIPVWLAELFSLSVEERRLRVIPFLVDVEPTDVPNFISSVTYIKKDTVYKERLLHAVRGRDITMESQLPVGDIASGFAWAFFVNYLRHVLPQIKERGQRKLREMNLKENDVHFVSVVLELIPKSLLCKDQLTQVHSEIYNIEGVGTVVPIETNVAGIGRVFNSNMYRITGKRPDVLEKDVLFMGEYATPIRTLKLMCHSMVAGLPEKQAKKQAKAFCDLLKHILRSESVPTEMKNTCEVVPVDGKCRLYLFDEQRNWMGRTAHIIITTLTNK
ncbi:hypothetical protein FSP39_012124 [Pinctada imbricata]|uniref:TIR domain-containing protein n=1 Tax=Pinctada imbricata TaxID=66713 RepID=A0AA88XVC7_PINIB|nr:hypothetical protein FSP39_012124 [Pinctada imbricata]